MSDTGEVELRGFVNRNQPPISNVGLPPNYGTGSWSESPQMGGGVNPTYHTIDEANRTRADSGVDEYPVDPSSGDRMYDFVPNNGTSVPAQIPPPVPPDARRTTLNQMYESRGDTLVHPHTKGEKPLLVADSISDADELEGHGCSMCKTVCLLMLVLIGLLLAIVAIVLVMLLWFGVYAPPTTAAVTTTCDSGMVESVVGGSRTSVPEPSPSCECVADLQPLYDEIQAEATNITRQIELLEVSLDSLSEESMSTLSNLTSQTNTLTSDVNSVNTSCYQTLDTLSSQNVSIAGLNFEASLLNVGVYNSCVYEYLGSCAFGDGQNNCSTSQHPVLVSGFFNIELACHVTFTGSGVPNYAPITNLRFSVQSGETVTDTNDADEVLSKSNIQCDCSQVALQNNPMNFGFTCSLFRARCPRVFDVNTTITTPDD